MFIKGPKEGQHDYISLVATDGASRLQCQAEKKR